MRVEDLKWYSPILLLVGAILSFADPITDILTLVEFYRSDHNTWFGVGLAFVILPCLVSPLVYYLAREDDEFSQHNGKRKCTQTILCGFHPFSAAFARLEGFVFCLKKRWRGDEVKTDGKDVEKADDLLQHIDFAVLFESVLESAPQFIIQLYAMSVQDEPAEVIQIISLPVSFLSLAWAFATVDELILRENHYLDALKLRHKLAIFISHLFLLSSRLFAVCYFTVSYKWWVIGVLLCHSFVIVTVDNCWLCVNGKWKLKDKGVFKFLLICVHWLRDDLTAQDIGESESAYGKTVLRKMQLLSNVLFVVENFFMILLFYFSPHSNTWYSLPVTVCVCLFSVLGSVIRVIHYRALLKEGSEDTAHRVPQPKKKLDSPHEELYWISLA